MTATATAKTPVDSSVCQCDHCGLPVPSALVDQAASEQFCCSGCRVAYEVIHGCGLEEYYRLREVSSKDHHRATGIGEAYAVYDAEAFQQKHVSLTAAGLATIELRLEGVHCAACVWLVERLPSLLDGVIEARLSLASCSVQVAWNPEQTTLSTIAATLDRFGYAPHPARDTSARDARLATERRQLTRLAVAGALAGNNMLIALALYAGVLEGIAVEHATLFRWASMAIGLVSLVWPGATFFRGAVAAVRTRTSSLDQPIALALGIGGLAGATNVLLNRGDIYFDSLSVLVFLLLVGRYLQARQQRWASDAVGMAIALTPESCRIVRGEHIATEPIEALDAGDQIEVRSGEALPADGEVLTGHSSIDASLLTGESSPVPIGPGDRVYSGAVNVGGVLRVNVTEVGETTRVGQLQRLVVEGLDARPPLVCFADRIGRWFVIVVAAIASLNALAWSLASGAAMAIDTTVAVLIVACPCALGLVTPLTMAMAIGRASRDGVLIKSAGLFEQLASVRPTKPGRLLLDKTGTLTRGELRVVAWHGDAGLLGVVGAAERGSSHPIACALSKYAERHKSPLVEVSEIEEVHGYGLRCRHNQQVLVIGAADWVLGQSSNAAPALRNAINDSQARGFTCVAVAIDGRVSAVASLEDGLHDDSRGAIQRLAAQGWRPEVLSGDHAATVNQLAEEIGVPTDAAHGRQSPEDKLKHVRDAISANHQLSPRPIIVMVGDGVNDAAALAAADVGIAVKGGAEAALNAADVYLSRSGIAQVVGLVHLARRTLRTARRNFAISLAYNVIAVSLASAGWITPLTAAVLMPISSATVLASAVCGVGRAATVRQGSDRSLSF